MQRVFDDTAGYYVLPPEDVTLATLGVPPYSPPPEDWDGEDAASFGSAEASDPADVSPFGTTAWAAPETAALGAGISFADMVRTISPAAEPDVWREDNRAPFGIPEDPLAIPGPSFDDLLTTIDPRADPDVWHDDHGAPAYAGWDDTAGYAVPYDPPAVALGAFRIPGLPEDATEWAWRDKSPGRVGGAETPAQLASMLERWMDLGMLGAGADFTQLPRGGYPTIGGGGGGGGGGSRSSSGGRGSGGSSSGEQSSGGSSSGQNSAGGASGQSSSGGSAGKGSSRDSAGGQPAPLREPKYEDITRRDSRFLNKRTDFTRSEYEEHLRQKGYSPRLSKDGAAKIYENSKGERYSIRERSDAGGPTADYYQFGSEKIHTKIRLKE